MAAASCENYVPVAFHGVVVVEHVLGMVVVVAAAVLVVVVALPPPHVPSSFV